MMKVVRDDIISAIRAAKVVLEPHKLNDEVALSDQGIDSLGLFNILLIIQDKYGVNIPDSDIDKLSTINMFIDYLNGYLD